MTTVYFAQEGHDRGGSFSSKSSTTLDKLQQLHDHFKDKGVLFGDGDNPTSEQWNVIDEMRDEAEEVIERIFGDIDCNLLQVLIDMIGDIYANRGYVLGECLQTIESGEGYTMHLEESTFGIATAKDKALLAVIDLDDENW